MSIVDGSKLLDTLIWHYFAVCVGLYVVYYATTAFYSVYLHPLAKFPGPKWWAASRIPWARHIVKGDLWQVLGPLHEKHGLYLRIGPDEISTTSPAVWKEVYNTRPLLPKDPYSQTPPLNGAHSLFTAAGEIHRRIRGVMVNGFSDKALRDQAPIIEGYACQLTERLRRDTMKSSHGVVDIGKLYGYAAFDMVTDLSFGESFQGLKSENEHPWISAFFLHAKFGTIRNCLSRFSPLDKILGAILLGSSRKNRERNWRMSTALIDYRLSKGDMTGIRSDFITPVIGKIRDDGQHGITKKELTTNGLAVVIANSQLTTVALSTATYLLLRRPQALIQLTNEVRQAFKSDDQITIQTTQGLIYLDAVINETLRIHHPTPINLPRVVPPEGLVVDGLSLPGNTVIGINLQNIQNDPSLWNEPSQFHPQRFLPPTDDRYDLRFDKDVKAAFMPFSTGPRNCLGGRFFMAQARLLLAKTFWNFDLELAEPGQDNWLTQKAYLVFEPKPLRVKLMARKVAGGRSAG